MDCKWELSKLFQQWDKGRIAALGWTDREQLVVVNEEGIVRLYPLHGSYTQFSLGKVKRRC